MDMFTTIYVFFMLFATVHATAWKPKTYIPGENVTVHIDQLHINEKNDLEITFSGYTSKLHVSNVLLYTPMKNQEDINMNYTGRIQRVKLNKEGFSFILLNVSFIDSGNYTVIERSLEKGKTSIIVPRQRLLGQNNKPIILSFTCNMTNLTSIKIEMMINTQHHFVLKYDVASENYTEDGELYRDRIEGCVLNGNTFSFNIRKVTLTDMGMFVAWGDMNILMDSVLLEFEESNELSSTERPHGYFNSSFVSNLASSDAENEVWLRLLFAAVGVAVTVPLTVASTLLILWRRGSFQFTCMGPDCCQHSLIDTTSDQDLKMGPNSKISTDSATVEYEEPRINETEISIYLEPIAEPAAKHTRSFIHMRIKE